MTLYVAVYVATAVLMKSCVLCEIKQFSRLKGNVSVFCRDSQSRKEHEEHGTGRIMIVIKLYVFNLTFPFRVKISPVSFLVAHFWMAVGQSFTAL
jgi:hypothetical protein